jgi:ATP-dependent helicase/nuclease subunit B
MNGEKYRLRLITSNTLFDSALRVIDQIKKDIANELATRYILIVPDNFALLTEKICFERLDLKSTFNFDVMTVSRLCSEVIKADNVLSKQGGVMIIKDICLKYKDNLSFFKEVNNLGLAEKIYETIMQLKSCNLKVDDIAFSNKDELFDKKINDLKFIFQKYEEVISNKFIDGSTKLKLFSQFIDSNDYFDGSKVYFAYFDNFTMQDYNIIESFIRKRIPTTIGTTYPTNKNNEHIYINDIYTKVKDLFYKLGISDNNIFKYEAKLNDTTDFLSKNLFSFNNTRKFEQTNNSMPVKIYQYQNQNDEVESTAKIIRGFVVNGKRYKDFGVAVSNDSYYPLIESIFSMYDIPFYIDKQTTLLDTNLGKFIIAILDGISSDFYEEDVIKIIKNVYFDFSGDEKEDYENYILKYQIEDKNKIQKINDYFNQNFIVKLNDFKNISICKDYVLEIKNFLDENNIVKTNQKLIENYKENKFLKQQKIEEQVINKLNSILDDLLKFCPESVLTLNEFEKILRTGFESCKIATIPIGVDDVLVGDAIQTEFCTIKNLFIIGANEGQLPKIKDDVGLISDKDIDLIQDKYLIEPKLQTINMRNRFKLFNLLLLPTESLFVSFSVLNTKNAEMRPAQFVLDLKNLIFGKDYMIIDPFNDYKMENKENFALDISNKSGLIKYIIKNKIQVSSISSLLKDEDLESYFDNDFKCKIDNCDDYFNNNSISASSLEDYFTCPFRFFMQKILNLNEKQKADIKVIDIGEILHLILQYFCERQKEDDKFYNDEELEKISTDIIEYVFNCEEFKTQISSASLVQIKSLKDEAYRLCKAINKQFNLSEFKPELFEKKISDDTIFHYKGKSLKFVGKIDRVDFYKDYFRIIDYKTGKSEFNYNLLYYGKKIQLFLYAYVFKKQFFDKNLAGVFYFPIKNNLLKFDEVEELPYKFKGACLKNEDILIKMDKNIKNFKDPYKSTIIPLEINDDNNFEKDNKYLVDNLELDKMCKYAVRVSQGAIDDLEKGDIDCLPENVDICENCKFNYICRNGKLGDYKVRDLPSVIKKDFSEVEIKDE